MNYNPETHHRRSIRLPGYDYTSVGAYFVTIVTHGRECMFGEIVDGVMHTNAAGQMVQRSWLDLANRFPGIALDTFVVMPNHFHGIVFIPDVGATLVVARERAGIQDRAGTSPAPTKTGPVVAQDVGATLVVAQERAGTLSDRAGTSPAPTKTGPVVAQESPAPTKTGRRWMLGEIVGAFKSITTHAYIQGVEQAGWLPFPGRLWQRNYHEHIIRDESTLHRIREYIANNPLQWAVDRENPLVGATHASPLMKDNPWRV